MLTIQAPRRSSWVQAALEAHYRKPRAERSSNRWGLDSFDLWTIRITHGTIELNMEGLIPRFGFRHEPVEAADYAQRVQRRVPFLSSPPPYLVDAGISPAPTNGPNRSGLTRTPSVARVVPVAA